MKKLGINYNWIEIERNHTSISFKEVRDDAYIIHTIPINLCIYIKGSYINEIIEKLNKELPKVWFPGAALEKKKRLIEYIILTLRSFL